MTMTEVEDESYREDEDSGDNNDDVCRADYS